MVGVYYWFGWYIVDSVSYVFMMDIDCYIGLDCIGNFKVNEF